MDKKIILNSLENKLLEKQRKRATFSIEGWSDEELELFEIYYKESIEELVDIFPNKSRPELLRAQKDRINRELYLCQEKYSEEEKELIIQNRYMTYANLQKLLPKRSIWSLMGMKRCLGLVKEANRTHLRSLTKKEYEKLAKLKKSGMKSPEICKEMDITLSHFRKIFYDLTPGEEIENFRKKYPNLTKRSAKTQRCWEPEEDEAILELTKEGMLLEDLAEAFKVTPLQMMNKQRALGIHASDVKSRKKERTAEEKEKRRLKREEQLKKDLAEAKEFREEIKKLGFKDMTAYTKILRRYKKEIRGNSNITEKLKLVQELEQLKSALGLKRIDAEYIKRVLKALKEVSEKDIEWSEVENYEIEFGKYKYTNILSVYENDPEYFAWLLEKSSKLVQIMSRIINRPGKKSN